ncbi:hypothetical protein BG015_002837 [Linnemannia schmuckeri]|uniref:Uncharacterized protein n=1 Tax=Linnemannia schmuckeri TaxID=64567 RepID=A0A9P5V618_9FUNG|nr:hypothetical protein BG015_002837 [Linnemannia schmuckeri]
MDTRNSQAKPSQLPSNQGSEALLGPTRRDARSVLHHPYEALSKAHHQQHQHHYRHHHHYLRHERYLHSQTSNSSEVWTLPPSRHSSPSTSASSLARTAEWLRWLIHSAAVSSLEAVPNDSTKQLMLLDLPVDGSCTGSRTRSEFDRMPGTRYYNQGTEETTGRPMSTAATTTRSSQSTTAKNHNNANAIGNSNNSGTGNNNNNNNNNNNSNTTNTNTRSNTGSGQSTTTPHQQSGSHPYPLTPSSWSSQPPTPPSPPSSFNRSTVNSATVAAAARNARSRGESDDKSASSSSSSGRRGSSSSSTGSTVGAGTPTSALLFSTSQEFHQVWSQTTAFLHRTFSPTYRVSHLYWDSWTNGTQRRGFERLKTSVLRGDAFRLMQNTTVQLRNLWNRSVAESKAHASEIERQAKAIEEKTRQIQQRAFGKSSSSSSSTSSTPSSETGHSKDNRNSGSSSSNKSDEGGQGKPRN